LRFIDPDGKQIIIRYQDDNGKIRRATYDYEKGIAKNKKGEEVHGKFLDQTVESLNYIRKGDENGIIKDISEKKKKVTIKETGKAGAFFVRNNITGRSTIYYNPTSALKTGENILESTISGSTVVLFREDGGTQSPALGLFHELGHNYENWNNRREQRRRARKSHESYHDLEEKYVIEKYENPAAKILEESTRGNHNGKPYESTGPTSTTEKGN
jgi:hypothetical protein